MQSKINQSKDNVVAVYGKVVSVVNQLTRALESAQKSLSAKERQIQSIIEQA